MTVKVIESQFRQLIDQWPDRPRILADGDSWFSRLTSMRRASSNNGRLNIWKKRKGM